MKARTVKLADNTISAEEMAALADWLKEGHQVTKGPLTRQFEAELADYIGLDVCLSILNVLKEGFGNPKYAPAILLVNMVKAGKLGVKSAEGFYKYDDSISE
jgi:hypothetical protein